MLITWFNRYLDYNVKKAGLKLINQIKQITLCNFSDSDQN